MVSSLTLLCQIFDAKTTTARATGEPGPSAKTWSEGFGAAGYSLNTNVTKLLPETTSYPVNYLANTAWDSTEKGVLDMLSHITSQSSLCPNQVFALGGHSQGGNVTFHAIPRMSKEVVGKVVAVTMFGSPKCPKEVEGRCNSYCYKGDFACDGPTGGAFGSGGTEGVAKGMLGIGGVKGVSKGGAGVKRVLGVRTEDGCAEVSKLEVTGVVPKVKGMAHMVYASDGVYVRAAACYIKSQFEKLKVVGT
jgi:hypothetical protein